MRITRPLRWRHRIVALSVAVFATTTACSASASTSSTAPFTLHVGFISTTSTPSGPEGWAYQSGALLKALKGVGVKTIVWAPFKNGPDLSAALTGGSLDIGILGDTPAIDAKASGVNTRVINQTSIGSDTWLFTAKGGPTTIAGLAGKTVATQVGSYMYRYLVALIDQQGLTGKVKVTHIYTADALPALTSGGIAAYAAPAGQLTAALQKAGFPLLDKASADHRDLLGSSVTVIRAKTLTAHPGLPAAWNKARSAAVADINGHSGQYYAFAAKATQTPVAVVEGATPISVYPNDPFTASGVALLSTTKDFLVKQGLAKSDFPLTDWQVTS
jgi:sulfonate transport system substrate-binding protein